MTGELRTALEERLVSLFGGEVRVERLALLGGGASMEAWAVDAQTPVDRFLSSFGAAREVGFFGMPSRCPMSTACFWRPGTRGSRCRVPTGISGSSSAARPLSWSAFKERRWDAVW